VPATAEEAEKELPPPGDPMKMFGFPEKEEVDTEASLL